MSRPPLPVATTLPKDARDALVAASQIRDWKVRAIAIQEAIERAQRKYPQFFHFYQGAVK